MIDVDDERMLEPGDAGPREVAALHHDHRVGVGAVHALGRSRSGPSRESPGSDRGAASALTMRTSLPSASSANAIASCEPIESPSGRACEVSRKRWRAADVVANAEDRGVSRDRYLGHRLGDRLVCPAARARRARSACRSWRMRSMRSCRSIDSSKKKSSSGDALEPQPPPDLAPEERRGALERPRAIPCRAFSSPIVV